MRVDVRPQRLDPEPLVSCIIPNYNNAAVVGETVQSCLAQTYPRLEVLVVDDGSTDDSLEVLDKFGDRITVLSQDNRGVSVARNVGVAHSQGALLAFCDSDDLWRADKTEKQVAALGAAPDAALCYTDFEPFGVRRAEAPRLFEFFDLIRRLARGPATPGALPLQNHVMMSSVMARRSAFVQSGGFRAGLSYPQDWLLWTAMEQVGTLLYLDEPLTLYRLHPAGRTLELSQPHQLELLAVQTFHSLLRAAQLLRDEEIRARFVAEYGRRLIHNVHEHMGLDEEAAPHAPHRAVGQMLVRFGAGSLPSLYARSFPQVVRMALLLAVRWIVPYGLRRQVARLRGRVKE